MSAHVRVPCSAANLGAGFDCIGVALDRWLDAHAVVSDEYSSALPIVERSGTLATTDAPTRDPTPDLTWRGFALACQTRGLGAPAGLRLRLQSEIPVARGLGSSAAALVAGVLLADRLLQLGIDSTECVALCARVEGHPDNVAPCVYGGAVLAIAAGSGYVVARLDVHERIGFVVCVPDFEMSTKTARAALPESIPFETGARAAAKSAALVRGLATADDALLRAALDDVLHVPFRRLLIPAFDDVVAAAIREGAWGATLSGSGSTIIALTPRDRSAEVTTAMANAWRSRGINASSNELRIVGGAQYPITASA